MSVQRGPRPPAWTLALLTLAGVLAGTAHAENIHTEEDKAWGENVGWINLEPSGDGGPGVQVDDFELTGWMWGENIGWISMSCKNTENCHAVPYGVRNNGGGFLSGYAWSENVGWISMSCVDRDSCADVSYGVAIDPSTGWFVGEAWGENIGWVAFDSAGAHPFRVTTEWRCDPPPPVPVGPPMLLVEKLGPEIALSWSGVPGATGFDIVFGELGSLRNNPAHFIAATAGCLDENRTLNSLTFPHTPPPGDGFWFLVRGVNCGGNGTQDTGEPGQIPGRDVAIVASGHDCS